MDLTLTIVFYACAGLALAGALASAVSPPGGRRGLALGAVAAGTGGVLATLSAGFAALVAFVCLGASALVLAGGGAAPQRRVRSALSAQVAAVAAALLFAAFAYAAWRGDFVGGSYPGGSFNSAALGRLLFGHDAPAVEAVAALLLVGLAAAASGLARRR